MLKHETYGRMRPLINASLPNKKQAKKTRGEAHNFQPLNSVLHIFQVHNENRKAQQGGIDEPPFVPN